MVLGNTESLNYVSNDGTCEHSWPTMLLGKTPLIGFKYVDMWLVCFGWLLGLYSLLCGCQGILDLM